MGRRVVDIENQRFGKWTVTGRVGSNAAGAILWHCHCDCGAEKMHVASKVKSSRHCVSCRHLASRQDPVKGLVTLARAHSELHYNANTGTFTWRAGRVGVRAGDEAGTIDALGYHRIMIGRRAYLGHRLAWLLTHGEWPEPTCDHINGVRSDNRLCNLRSATRQEQTYNKRATKSKSGLKGAAWDKHASSLNPWKARITVNGRGIHLGMFATAKEAHDVYCEAATKHHGKFARFQ